MLGIQEEMRSEELGSKREWKRAPKEASSRWGKYKLDDDDRELIKKHDIRTREETLSLLSSNYWSTINQILASKSVTKKSSLPASYELDSVNWIQVLFDYLVTSQAGSGVAKIDPKPGHWRCLIISSSQERRRQTKPSS